MDMTRYLIIATALTACAPNSPAVTSAVTPTNHRELIQSRIDAACDAPDGGLVLVDSGQWPIERAPAGSRNRFAGLSLGAGCRGVTLEGAGPDAVLELVGDMGGSAAWLISVDPGAESVRITGLTMTISATATGEQTHAITTSGICEGAGCRPIRDLQVDHVRIDWPFTGAWRSGDGIRLLGNGPGTEVLGARITDSTISGARSAIGLQRGLHDVVIADNKLHTEAGDQTVDSEPSCDNPDDCAIHRLKVIGNSLTSGAAAQGEWALTISTCEDCTVTGNTMDRGIQVYRTRNTTITGNPITATMRTGVGVVDVANRCDGLVLSGNPITRRGVAGPAIKVEPHTTICSGASIASNPITQSTPSPAIVAVSMSRSSIANNPITHTVPNPAASIHVSSSRAESPVRELVIASNIISGPVTYGVMLEAYPASFGAGVAVIGNVASGSTFGLRLDAPGAAVFAAPITSTGNGMGPAALGGHAVTRGD